MEIKVRRVDWEFARPFRIAYRVRTHAQTIQVELHNEGIVGRGEALGVSYHRETVDTLIDQLAQIEPKVVEGITREDLRALLPPGGARNAVDCALWDLEAKKKERRVWELAGLPTVRALTTAYTLGVDTPEVIAQLAASAAKNSLFKIKLTGSDDLERVVAVRETRPDADLIVDANQSWSEQQLHELTPRFAELGVKLIEQPLPIGQDSPLRHFRSPVPLCADESCQTTESLPSLAGQYEYIAIKLDKTGGLTEALDLARAAKEQGFKVMIGCMGGSSLSMAPAFVVGQLCDFVDLDGPLLAKADVPHAIHYQGSQMFPPEKLLWG